ncbi:MAG: hypothetical protein Q7U48_13520 [Hydrogenophaga sp.]|nr:hypothetical protein [Hydrogenophaga sp.]
MSDFEHPRKADTPSEMRAEMARLRRQDAIVHNAMTAADVAGLSGEDRYTFLAYHALVALSNTRESYLEHMARTQSMYLIKPNHGSAGYTDIASDGGMDSRDRTKPYGLRLHRAPRKVARIRAEFRSAKQRWLFERSKARYDVWPEGLHTNEALRAACLESEIGQIDGFRVVFSPVEQA